LISDGTGITVIAIHVVSHEKTTAGLVAGIVGAKILIIADHLSSHALAGDAVIRHGAGISVDTLAFVQRQMLAAVRTEAAIFCTQVVIIASSFVDISVTIIVEPVTGLFRRNCRITIREPIIRANPFALTSSPLIDHITGRPQGEFDSS